MHGPRHANYGERDSPPPPSLFFTPCRRTRPRRLLHSPPVAYHVSMRNSGGCRSVDPLPRPVHAPTSGFASPSPRFTRVTPPLSPARRQASHRRLRSRAFPDAPPHRPTPAPRPQEGANSGQGRPPVVASGVAATPRLVSALILIGHANPVATPPRRLLPRVLLGPLPPTSLPPNRRISGKSHREPSESHRSSKRRLGGRF